eukprot:1187451-Prorocentrum_minimum.AAC.2
MQKREGRRGPRQGWSTGQKALRWAAGRTSLPRPTLCKPTQLVLFITPGVDLIRAVLINKSDGGLVKGPVSCALIICSPLPGVDLISLLRAVLIKSDLVVL